MSIPITLSVEEKTNEQINAIAKATRRTRSAVVDMAIELLAQQEEFADLAETSPSKRTTKKQTGRLNYSKIAEAA